jgi:o-succinylbenzoate synthase
MEPVQVFKRNGFSKKFSKKNKMMPIISGLAAYRIRLPLIRPYHLSLGTLEAFEGLIVRIQADGEEGFGEAIDVPGYYIQGLYDAWRFVCKYGSKLPGRDPEVALKEIIAEGSTLSFAATPLLTALESLIHFSQGRRVGAAQIPLVGIIQGETPAAMVCDAIRLMEDGYQTLKFKVGFSVNEDLDRVRYLQDHLQAHLKRGVQLRLDANQGYDYSRALQFLEGLDPRGIELLEQPLRRGAWDEMLALAKSSPIPLMLDEGIAVEEDLDRAIETGCAEAVKFKLMKCGSFSHLEKMIEKAWGAGLKVILGNGVATDIGCFHEALIAAKLGLTVNAGEMNGFLKGIEQFLQPRLHIDKGNLVLCSDGVKINWGLVSKFTLESISWGDIIIAD